jgi:hypothetical protein
MNVASIERASSWLADSATVTIQNLANGLKEYAQGPSLPFKRPIQTDPDASSKSRLRLVHLGWRARSISSRKEVS